MDSATYAVLESKARRIHEESLPIDPDECHAEGIDFDALFSLVNQFSIRALKAARTQEPLLVQAIVNRIAASAVYLKRTGASSEKERSAGKNEANKFSADHDANNAIAPECTCPAISRRFRVNGYKLVRQVLETKYGRGILSIQHLLTESSTLLDHDKVLLGEILQCMAFDRLNAHPCEQLKECVGREYEEYLIDRLKQQHMCFETEAELRSRGKPKTPDILFLIPMAVRRNSMHKQGSSTAGSGKICAQSTDSTWDDATDDAYMSRLSSDIAASAVSPTHARANTRSHTHAAHALSANSAASPGLSISLSSPSDVSVVNWIDSKALFADQETFAEHFEQLRGYVNRYGRGLVIYWHGYNAAIRDRCVCMCMHACACACMCVHVCIICRVVCDPNPDPTTFFAPHSLPRVSLSDLFLSTDGMILLADTFPREWISPLKDTATPTTPTAATASLFA